MELFKRQPLLLGVLVLLLSIRFVVVPIIDWQNQGLEQIKGLQKKEHKTQIAIQREDDNKILLQKLENQSLTFNDLFFVTNDEATFKLEQQQWLEALLASHNLKSTNIGWANSAQVTNTPIIKHTLRLGLQGAIVNLPAFQLELEKTQQWIDIANFSISLKRQIKLNLGQATGAYELNFYQLSSNNEAAKND